MLRVLFACTYFILRWLASFSWVSGLLHIFLLNLHNTLLLKYLQITPFSCFWINLKLLVSGLYSLSFSLSLSSPLFICYIRPTLYLNNILLFVHLIWKINMWNKWMWLRIDANIRTDIMHFKLSNNRGEDITFPGRQILWAAKFFWIH